MKITIEFEVSGEYEAEALRRRAQMLNDPDWISSWWHIDDVKGQANGWDEEDTEHSITDEEAREVLRLADKYHNCDVGICWDVLDGWIDHVIAQRKETV